MERLGRYELTGVLGRGGQGVVYEALLHGPAGFRKPVAVKVLHEGADAIRREARIAGLLRHRHLVDVYEVGESGGRWFAALELCTGGSLRRALPLPPRAVVEVGLQVCEALQYAHEELGLVHLDLKPDNLFLGGGDVKVGDLGLAQAEGFGQARRIRGTPGYMAPEQLRGGPLDARADVYALGATLVELATGSTTAGGHTATDGSWDPSEGPVVPEWLAPAVERCLERHPDDRWPSMAALAEALRRLGVHGPGLREALGLREPPVPPVPTDTNVRPDADAFVGRASELAELAARLATPGIVEVRGPAGIGKSRLAATAALRWHRSTGRPAFVCDTSEVRGLQGLAVAVATALGVPLEGGEADAVELLGDALAGRGDLLVVVDGFEHLAAHVHVLERWRARAPSARLVVTTRVAVQGDVTVAIGPLSVDDAVALLGTRARERGAEVGEDPRLPELAARLDGVPLALELAAGRLGVLTVADVLERLSLSLLTDGSGERHGTLRAALDWSWELLSPVERAALAQLSVFVGGFTLEAADAVLDLEGHTRFLMGHLERRLGRPERARTRYAEAARLFAASGDQVYGARAHEALASLDHD